MNGSLPEKASSQQIFLSRKLANKSVELSAMYGGAIWALDEESNPERLAHAAHSLRELMEKIPKYFDIPIRPEVRLGDKVTHYLKEWEKAKKRSPCLAADSDGKPIDPALSRFLALTQEFAEWYAKSTSTRREQAEELLDALDVSRRRLPAPILNIHVAEWREIREYFLAIAHHGKETTEADFVGWIEELECFMLNKMAPRTFEQLDEIDALLREGESNDNG